MFNEKNIPKLIILAPIVTILILSSTILYSLILIQENYLKKEIKKIEKQSIKKQIHLLKQEIEQIYKYIEFHEEITIKNIKLDLLKRMEISYNNPIKKDNEIIIYKIKEENPSLVNKELLKKIKDLKEYTILKENNILYFYKYFEEKESIFLIKKDISEDIKKLKNTVARWVEKLDFGENNYFFIYSIDNILLSHPHRPDEIGDDHTFLKYGDDPKLIQKFVQAAIKNPNGTIVEYLWPKPFQNNWIQKETFVKLYKEWNWILCAGIYLDDIEKIVKQKRDNLETTIHNYIKSITIISLFLIFISSLIAIKLSSKINSTFKDYQKKVTNREFELQILNRGLNEKVALGIEEAKEKDRAMLHQSRLARMGKLLNMISHQWRQPLSQLSGIIMELETAIEFKKAKRKYILTSLNDANSIIEHMSLTIEDFKSFFKPEKEKEKFLVSKACEDAKTLIKDTYTNEKIKLVINLVKDKEIYGYKREYSQVILNMFLNAKDQLIEKEIKDKKVSLTINSKDEKSIVTVEDNAGGIELDNLDMIFEPYFSTKKSQGTGLGLYMSKMIIEKNMEGSLTVSNDEYGAVFKIEV